MGCKKKITKEVSAKYSKHTVTARGGSDGEKVVWVYDKIDRGGKFAFDLDRSEFKHRDYLEKMINYSSMTWIDVKKQTHDKGKSKHHYLSPESMSKAAYDRMRNLPCFTEYEDSVFSFAFDNLLRVIGIRDKQFFHVVWYDAYHEVCPASKKNT